MRSGAAALVATLAFAACAGQQSVVPSSSSAGSTSNSLGLVEPNAASGCPIAVGWKFGGPCVAFSVKKPYSTATLKRYKGYGVSVQYAERLQGSTKLVLQVATGNGDITGKFQRQAFPPDKHAFLYLAVLDPGKYIGFNQYPKYTFTASSNFKGPCYLDTLYGSIWYSFPWLQGGVIQGKTLTFDFYPSIWGFEGPIYLAVRCK
jgi:hypothetical protein